MYNNDNSIKQEISPFNENIGELIVPNKQMYKIIYDAKDGDSDFEISLRDFLRKKDLQRKLVNKLTLEKLQNVGGFNDISLIGFQSDIIHDVQIIEADIPFEFDYIVSKIAFYTFIHFQEYI